MKKKLFTILCLAIIYSGYGQNAIPNPGFEIWNANPNYDDPADWGTINGFTYFLGVRTVTKATAAQDVHGGSFAIKLESKNVPLQGTAPGIAATGSINTSGYIDGGVAYNKRPIRITGWYKYTPSSGSPDTMGVDARISKWNTGTHHRDEIAVAEFNQNLTVSGYTQFSADFTYSSGNYPDTLVIILLTSSQGNNSPVGSKLWIDDLNLELCTGFAVNPTASSATCALANGSATAVVVNGNTPFSYHWSNNSTSSTITTVAGNYAVTVTDGNGCSVTSSVTVSSTNTAINPSATSTNTICTSHSGTATASASAGSNPYTYLWSANANNATTATASNLDGGNYQVTISDVNGCTGTASVTVGVTAPTVTSTISSTTTSCASNTGTATVTPTSGTANYGYLWTGGGTTQMISNLGAGSYTVTITDANGCTGTNAVSVNTPNGPSATQATTNVTCHGLSNGAVDVTETGGTGTITYAWSSTGATVPDLTGLAAGTYTLTINDANNCSFTLSAVVTEPDALTLTDVTLGASCHGGANGSVDITTAGGTSAYTYVWSSGETSEDLSGLVAGGKTVTVTDAHSCTAEHSITVTQPTAITLTETHNNVACKGNATGSIDLTANGGTPNYTYLWTGGADTNLAAGTYNVTVTDAHNCTATLSVTITEPAQPLSASVTATDATSPTANDGAASSAVTGGTSNYTYLWTTGAITPDLSGLGVGNYCVTVTDANSCTVTACDAVAAPSAIGTIGNETIKLYPNPANSQVEIEINSSDKFNFSVYSLDGKLLEEKTITGNKATVVLTELPVGSYTYQLKNTTTGETGFGQLQIQR